MPLEELQASSFTVTRFGGTVTRAGEEDESKLLVRLHQGIDHLNRAGRVHVAIPAPEEWQQISPQPMRLRDVGTGLVLRADQPAHPCFVPKNLVDEVVAAIAIRDGDGTEMATRAPEPQCFPPSGRATADAGAAK